MSLFDNLVDLPIRRHKGRAGLDMPRCYMKAKRKHKKRHSENKERSFLDSQRALKAKLASAKQSADRAAFLALARAYWRGEIAEHP